MLWYHYTGNQIHKIGSVIKSPYCLATIVKVCSNIARATVINQQHLSIYEMNTALVHFFWHEHLGISKTWNGCTQQTCNGILTAFGLQPDHSSGASNTGLTTTDYETCSCQIEIKSQHMTGNWFHQPAKILEDWPEKLTDIDFSVTVWTLGVHTHCGLPRDRDR